jgi:hypothetical protein
LADRVRAHVLLCMLAHYLEWLMHQSVAPMLFEDTDKQQLKRHAPVSRHRRSAHQLPC